MKRTIAAIAVGLVSSLIIVPAAHACGFLVSANGAVRLGETTTFVAWEDGVEHYITSFTFEGPAESFGSLIPLPAEPTAVTRAGDWTLQRLKREVSPFDFEARSATAPAALGEDVEIILRTPIDALDVVVLKGGGADVLAWVNENGFALPPGPETDHMLDYYGSRSPYFLAARFDATAAAEDDFIAGDGIPVKITMPDGTTLGPAAHPSWSHTGFRDHCCRRLSAHAGAAGPASRRRPHRRGLAAGRRHPSSRICAPTTTWSGSRTTLG